MKQTALRGTLIAAIGLVAAAAWVFIALVDKPSGPPQAAASPNSSASESTGNQATPPEEPLRAVIPAQPDSRVTQASPPDDAVEEVPTPEPPPMFSEEDEEAWRQSFAEASVEEILAAKAALIAEVEAKANPILDNMHAAGLSEYIGPEHIYDRGDIDNLDIVAVYMEYGGGTYKMQLPPDQYPDLYALKARAMWLKALAHDREHHEPLTKNAGSIPR